MSVQNNPAVYNIIRDKDGAILFVKRSNTGFMDGMYSLPAGRVESDEVYTAAAVREAHEEVGISLNQDEIGFSYMQHRHSTEANSDTTVWTDVFFEAGPWQGEPYNAEPDKHSEVAWFYPDELPDDIMPYQRYALDRIAQGHLYGEYGWEDRALEAPHL